MPEAVIVSAARSPIGRANKGSLKDFRPDDLSALIIKAALDKVPELDPTTIDDLMLGCGLPGGESGYNMGRVVATLLGYDEIPGTTITRYCSSSVQTSRMAFHAIKAGEGDVFISAGVETVSRFAQGHLRPHPRHPQPAVRRGDRAAPRSTPQGGQDWHDPREDGEAPRHLHRHGPDGRERRPHARARPQGARRVRRPQPEPRREGDQRRLLGQRDHPGHRARRHRGRQRTTARAPASPTRRSPSSSRSSAPTAWSPPATAARSTTARPPSSSCRTPRPTSSASPRSPGSSRPASPGSPPRSWASARSRRPSRRSSAPA